MVKNMHNVDLLNLEWTSSPSRDRQMATLVCNYLRYIGFNIVEGSVFNGFFLLAKLQPIIFFITNTTGAEINFELLKYAKERGIKSVSLISEGILNEEKGLIEMMVWGWNRDKNLYEDIHMQWSEKSRDITYKYYPELTGKIKVSGAVVFDVYKIATTFDKNTFLKKYFKCSFTKIIGVGCYDFGSFYPEDPRYSLNINRLKKLEIDRMIKDQNDFNAILKITIVNNKNILFLLKEHPGCLGGNKASGIEGLSHYDNVLILKNEESVGTCISVSDFWLVYESTTAIEAWLLQKQTCLLNPSGTDFNRDSVHRGSPNYQTVKALQYAIYEFYETGELPNFKKLENIRQQIINDTIQWDDGLNHVRAGNEIIEILEKNKNVTLKKSHIFTIKTFKQMIYWYLSPYFPFLSRFKLMSKHVLDFNANELKDFQKKRMNEQIAFYQKNNLKPEDLRKIRCI